MSASAGGTLYVVATPIGNLEDITLRGLRILREVALVAAEDTRRTGHLLRHFGIATRLVSLHAHNERQRVGYLVRRLRAGEAVALVTDAGTPGISDPGAVLVRAAREAGVRVDPVPGPSAVTAALSASGLPADRFAFAGFVPVKGKDRKLWFDWVAGLPDTCVVCFEAPHRIDRTLTELAHLLVDRPIVIARELTKVHEEWAFLPAGGSRQVPSAPAPQHRGGDRSRGEFVVLIGPRETDARRRETHPSGSAEAVDACDDDAIVHMFGQLTEQRTGSRREALRATAERLGLPVKTVYAALERAKRR